MPFALALVYGTYIRSQEAHWTTLLVRQYFSLFSCQTVLPAEIFQGFSQKALFLCHLYAAYQKNQSKKAQPNNLVMYPYHNRTYLKIKIW